MRTKIFEYKGIIGIQSDPDAEGLVAKPENGNLGCVVHADFVDISPEALELLKEVKKGKDNIGDIDVFEAGEGIVILGWLGGYLNAFKPTDILGSKDYNPALLKPTEGVEVPEEFKDFVDNL